MIEIKLTEEKLSKLLKSYYIKVYDKDVSLYITIEKGEGVNSDYPWEAIYLNRTKVIDKQNIKIKERLCKEEILEALEKSLDLSNTKAFSIKPKFSVIKGYGLGKDIVNIDFYEIIFRKQQKTKILRKE